MTRACVLSAFVGMFTFAGTICFSDRDCDAQQVDEQAGNAREKRTIAPAMLEEMSYTAAKAYEATAAGYDVGTEILANVHLWSRRWLEAERALAETDAEEIAAIQAHRQRMKLLLRKVKALNDHGVKGGEQEKFFAAKYYLAEANAWLTAARHRGDKPPMLSKLNIEFHGPKGMAVRWQEHNESEYSSKPVACPTSHSFLEGRVYLVEFSGVGPAKFEAMLDLTGTTDKSLLLQLTDEDVKRLTAGNQMTQIFFRSEEVGVSVAGDWNEAETTLIADTERQHEVLAIVGINRR